MKRLDEKNLKQHSKKFRVNEISNFLGITPRILKHYEDTGVVLPERSKNNDYREYSAEDTIKLQEAEKLKRIAFSQKEIAGYFNGDLDIEQKRNDLVELRSLIDSTIDLLNMEIEYGKPRFSIYDEQSLLCFCKNYPLTGDPMQMYLFSRDAYTCAIEAGCRCDIMHTFFVVRNNVFPLSQADRDNNESMEYLVPTVMLKRQDSDNKICVPILYAPDKLADSATVENVTLKKSIVMKYVGDFLEGGQAYFMLQQEADRQNLTLSGKAWTVSETGPNKKTSNRTYTLVIGAEIAE